MLDKLKAKKREADSELLYTLGADKLSEKNRIAEDLYVKNKVKRGLRNSNGTGVVVGLTHIGEVHGYDKDENGDKIPSPAPVRDAVLALEGKYREVIVLYYDREMKLGEIARTLQLPINTVSTRLRRARALLKKALGEEVDA